MSTQRSNGRGQDRRSAPDLTSTVDDRGQLLLAAAVDQAPSAVVITDAEFRIVYVNPAFERLTGRTILETIGQQVRALTDDADPTAYASMWHVLTGGRPWRGSVLDRAHDGRRLDLEVAVLPVRDGQTITNYLATILDVTKERELEDRLSDLRRLDALGRLAAGIAHDFNNVLMAVAGNAELVLASFGEGDERAEAMREILQAAALGRRLTRELMALGGSQTAGPSILDLNEVIRRVEPLLRQSLGQGISLVIDLASAACRIRASETQMEQAILNLALNGRDAMPNGGSIRLETALLDQRTDHALNATSCCRQVALRVVDVGVGMDEATKARIFEPFFTTKAGKGTGLGLAVVAAIVAWSGGRIDVASSPGRGTTFTILIPWIEPAAA